MEQGNYDYGSRVDIKPFPFLGGKASLEEKCKLCGKLFDFALLRKLQKGLLCFPCVEIDKVKRREKLRERRKELLTDPSRGVICDVCQKVFLLPSELKKHYDNVHICLRPYTCDVCGYKFARPQEMKKHKAYKHENTRNYPCSICNHSFKCNNALKRHVKLHENNNTYYTCDDCGKHLKSKKSLENHKELHARKNQLHCQFCNQSFVARSIMELHITEVHKKAKRILCDECGSSFKNRKALTRHKRRHRNLYFPCEVCGLNLRSKYTLKLHHLTLHTSKSEAHTCDECGQIFGHFMILNRHKLKHARERKSENFSCHLCHLKFCSSENLQRHLRSHSKEKNLKCGDCGKKFLYNFGLMRHVKTAHVDSL